MIVNQQFAPFNYLINSLLANDHLCALEPIVAGGFPLALFSTLKNIDSAEGWTRLYDQVNKQRFRAVATAFGDVDCYFMHDSPVWHGEHRWLVGDARQPETEFPPDNIFGLRRTPRACNFRWANNFTRFHQENWIDYQFIKNPQTSVEECLADFDLKISCLAWYKDYIFVHETFEDAFDRAEIQTNAPGFNKRSRDDVYARMFTALRAYKFASRLRFELSDELDAYCCVLYAETKSMDLNSDSALLDADGRSTRNPVPSSPAFRGVVKQFWQRHEAYQFDAGRSLSPRTRL